MEGLAAEGDRVDAGAQPGAAPRGEFIGREEPAAPKGPPLDEMIAKILLVTFTVAAPNWKVTLPECSMLGSAYCDVINKYFPGGVTIGPELGALFATVVVFGPRLNTPPRAEAPKPQEEPAAAPAAGA